MSPSIALDPQYRTLRDQINSNQPLDTGLVRDLPEPTTAREHWLRSFTRTRLSNALSDLQSAVEAGSADRLSTYLQTWLNLVLLDDPARDRLEYLRRSLNRNKSSITPEVWLHAGKYAGAFEEFSLAARWSNRALKKEQTRPEALLDLAEFNLRDGALDRADRYLDRYILTRPGRTDSRYWIIRGDYFRARQSDSEAYVAYSHLVRNYPGSMVLRRAESNLENLSLPEAFRPGEVGGGSPVPSGVNQPDESSDPRGRWVIQIGSFSDRGRARRFRRRLSSKVNGSLVIREAMVKGTRYHRVQLVGFRTKDQASRRQKQLQRQGIDSFVMKGPEQ